MMRRIGIYATGDQEIHNLIGEMFERKTGAKISGYVGLTHHYMYVDRGGEIHGTGENSESQYSYRLVTLEELDKMPDYAAIKEMTLPEIIKELGYEVKIVK